MLIWNLRTGVLCLTQPGFAGKLGWMSVLEFQWPWGSFSLNKRVYRGSKWGWYPTAVLRQAETLLLPMVPVLPFSCSFSKAGCTLVVLLWSLQPCDELSVSCCSSQHQGGWAETCSQQLGRVGGPLLLTAPKQLRFSIGWHRTLSSSCDFLLVNFLF